MIKELLKKYNGRFTSHVYLEEYSLIPTYQIFDKLTGETVSIKIDSINANIEVVIKNFLDEKIIESRNKKINSVINGN